MNQGFEIIDTDEIKKIKGVNFNNEFIEIRFKNNWLDVIACKTVGGNTTTIFRKLMTEDMSIDDMMQYFSVIVE
jgi:hypothetical protein